MKKLRDWIRLIPLFGGLVDCTLRDHWNSLGETMVTLVLSTTPLWLGALIIYLTAALGYGPALRSTVSRGELFMYSTALLAPIFWIALVDPPGARRFPSKVSHMIIIAVIDMIAAVCFGLNVAGKELNPVRAFPLSVFLFGTAVVLFYLGTVYHASRLPDAAGEFRREEEIFTEAVREHRDEP